MSKKVTIFNFSPRKSGNCSNIAEFVADFHNRTNVQSVQFTTENCKPRDNCDYQCLNPNAGGCPSSSAEFAKIMDQAAASDLLYFIVPNFCGYPNANYFAFNERLVGYFGANRTARGKYMSIEKKFIIVSNTEGDNFRNAMQQQTTGEPKLLYLKSGKYHKRSTEGDMLASEDAQRDLCAFLTE